MSKHLARSINQQILHKTAIVFSVVLLLSIAILVLHRNVEIPLVNAAGTVTYRETWNGQPITSWMGTANSPGVFGQQFHSVTAWNVSGTVGSASYTESWTATDGISSRVDEGGNWGSYIYRGLPPQLMYSNWAATQWQVTGTITTP